MIAARKTAAVGSETTQIVSNTIGRIILCSPAAQPAGRDGYRKSFQINLPGHADQQHGVFRSQQGGDSRSGQHHTMQNGCVVTAGCDQHEAVPYCVVEWQRPPEVKADADGIEHAANSDQKRRQSVYRAKHGSHPQQDHPAQGHRFAMDSLLEGTGFEPLVPRRKTCLRPGEQKKASSSSSTPRMRLGPQGDRGAKPYSLLRERGT